MPKLDYCNLFEEFVEDVDRVLQEDSEETLNIIEFIEQEVDLGITLTIQQSTILKAYYNLPLTEEEISILEYWKANNRCTWEQDAHYQILVLESGRRSGKCLNQDTLINTNKGLLKLSQLINSPKIGWNNLGDAYQVANEGRGNISTTDKLYNKGLSDTKIIKTKSGYSIEGTSEHRIKVLSDKGIIVWRRLDKLKDNDYVCIHRNTDLWAENNIDLTSIGGDTIFDYSTTKITRKTYLPKYLNKDWAYFLGILTATGKYRKNSGLLCVINSIDKHDYINKAKELSLQTILYSPNETKNTITYLHEPIKSFINNLGADTNSKRYTRTTPWSIMQSPKHIVQEYLKGLFDGSGSLNYREKQIEFYFESSLLAKETQLLLLNLGIISKTESNDRKYSIHKLIIKEARSQRLFCLLIGSELTRFKGVLPLWFRDTVDEPTLVPNQSSLIKKLIKTGVNKDFFDVSLHCIKQNYLPQIIEACRVNNVDSEVIKHLQQLDDLDYFYDKIVFSEDSSSICYDLNVETTHHYVANGFTTHNSSLASVIAVYEFYRLSKMRSPQEHYGIARSTPISIIVLATTASQGKKTIFRNVVGLLKNSKSKYFKKLEDEGRLFVGKEEVSFEEKLLYIYSGNSQSGAQVGGTVKALIMDEVARFKDKDGKSNAIELWTNLGISTTTFGREARLVGISSAWFEWDAIEQLYEKTKTDTAALGIKSRSWDLNPIHAARDNPIVASYYNSDPVQAALEYEGVRPAAVDAFLNSDEVKHAFKGRSIIFVTKYEDELDPIIVDDISKLYKLVKLKIDHIKSTGVESLVCHLDPAINNDAYAMALGHNDLDNEGRQIAVIDSFLVWEPTYNTQVSIANVQDIILEIHSEIPIRKLTADHYNSAETIQRLRQHGIVAETTFFSNRLQLSMYSLLRQLLHERRIILPYDSPWTPLALSELCKVQLIRGIKIDHEPSGSKDLSDAIAGVCWTLADRLLIDGASRAGGLIKEHVKPISTSKISSVPLSANNNDPRSQVLAGLSGRNKWLQTQNGILLNSNKLL
jgi:intein/homing endonuclease